MPTAAVAIDIGKIEPSSKLIDPGSLAGRETLTRQCSWKVPLSGSFELSTSSKPVTLSPSLKWVTLDQTSSTVPAASLPRIVGYYSIKYPLSLIFQSTGFVAIAAFSTKMTLGLAWG
jgi:hypothetical protein